MRSKPRRAVTVGVRFDPEQAAELRLKAQEAGCTYSELVRRAIRLYCDDRPVMFRLRWPQDNPNVFYDYGTPTTAQWGTEQGDSGHA